MNVFSIEESTKTEVDFIEKRLIEYNESNVPFEPPIPFSKINRHIKDETGLIIAGINCIYYSWKCLYIDALWVHKDYREQGLGTKLMKEIEITSEENGIHLIHLETFDFQAIDFYIRNGFEIFGVLDDCPIEHKRYYLKKYLKENR